jgi:hypothetical protein
MTQSRAVAASSQPQSKQLRNTNWAIAGWSSFVLAGLASIFFIPRLVSVSPSISSSYLFNYSNRTGILILLGFLVVGGYFSKSLRVHFRAPSVEGKISAPLLAQWMGITAVIWAVMYFLVHGLQGFAESLYMIDRLKMLVEGGRPYRDFEFAYGALLLYGPRALMVLHLDVEQAYFLFLLACYLVSVWMLARILDLLDYPTTHKATIFSLLVLFSLPTLLCTGLNYVLLRFLAAPYFGLLVQRMDGPGGLEPGGLRRRAFAMLMSAGFTVVLLLISPEMGVAFGVGTLGYFVVFGWRDRKNIALCAGLLCLDALIFAAANRLDVFATLKAFAGGAFNFPLLPAAHILLFFFCCGLVTLFVAARLRSGSRGDGMLMLVAVSTPMIASALGRCDVGHTVLSGVGLVIVGTVLASGFPRLWRGYRIAFLIVFILIPATTGIWSYLPLLSKLMFIRIFQAEPQGTMTHMDTMIERGMQRQLGEVQGRIKFAKLKAANSVKTEFNLQTAHPELTGVMEAPFGYSPKGFGTYHSAGIDAGYFDGVNNLFTSSMIQRKVEELQAYPERKLLLPENFEDQCKVDPEMDRKQIRTLFAYPFGWKARHFDSIRTPLCSYIAGHYHETIDLGPQAYGYTIWAQ